MGVRWHVGLANKTILSVPMLRGDKAVGALTIRRSEVRPFTDQEIELVETFADGRRRSRHQGRSASLRCTGARSGSSRNPAKARHSLSRFR